MAEIHFGNLAYLFKHLALAEVLGALRPAEYWESHAGFAFHCEFSAEIPPERQHGVETFLRVSSDFPALRMSLYHRLLAQGRAFETPRTAGSPVLARALMNENSRRLLFCGTDPDALGTARDPLGGPGAAKEIHTDKVECVQDDGVMVLRGACMLLPEPWISSTLAFINPPDIHAPSDAGITALELACEIANRGIPTLLCYDADDPGHQSRQHASIQQALEKACLVKRGCHRFDGSLRKIPSPSALPPTQWGYGLLAFNLHADALTVVDQKLRALESAYAKIDFPAWCPEAHAGALAYSHASL